MSVDLLQRLTAAAGVPGFEGEVRAIVREALTPLTDEVRVDHIGNVIATKFGSRGPRILIAAHMDEIGFLVRHVGERGFLRLQPLGSFDPRVLLAQRVVIHTASGRQVGGVIETTTQPLHFGAPTDPVHPDIQDLFVDVGAEAVGVEIGDAVTLDREMVASADRIVSGALDDRLGLYVLVETIRQLGKHGSTILALATVQEEIESHGAVVAGYDLGLDTCIALDLTVANDIPGASPEQEVTRLGDGPAIKIMDTTQISHLGIVRHMRDIAPNLDIPLQLEELYHGGTDASLIQRLRSGVVAVTLSVPTRYIHTVNETVAVSDVEHCVTLLPRCLEEAHARDYVERV